MLALALALAAGRLAASWEGELADTATLQVIAPEDGIEEQARAALNVLRTTPGVRSVRMVDLAEQEKLLEPWLGPDIPVESLPLPLLIEVATDRDRLNPESLALRLEAEAPGAVFDDHAAWRQPLIATAERLRIFALGCLGLMALALAAVLGLAAHAAIAANGPAIRDAAPRRRRATASSPAPSPAASCCAPPRGRSSAASPAWRCSRCCRGRASRGSSSSASASSAGTGSCPSPSRRPPAPSPGRRPATATRRSLRRWS